MGSLSKIKAKYSIKFSNHHLKEIFIDNLPLLTFF